RVDGGGRNHGPATQGARRRGGAVPPGERPHPRRQDARRQLAAPGRGAARFEGVMTANGDGHDKLFDRTLARLLAREGLGGPEARAAFEATLAGAWTPVQIGAFAVGLRINGETAEVIAGAVEAMRGAMAAVKHDLPLVVDTCGTGGDGAHT